MTEIALIDAPIKRMGPEFLSPEGFASLGIEGLQVGCRESLHDGCLNTDIVHLTNEAGEQTDAGGLFSVGGAYYFEHDATAPFPLPDDFLQFVFSEHFIEHISQEEACQWLSEMYRVLRPGGLIRLSTPDLGIYCRGYVDPDKAFLNAHHEVLQQLSDKPVPKRPAPLINQIFYLFGHRFIYDFEELQWMLQGAGFNQSSIQNCSFRQGSMPEVALRDLEIRSDESVYIEARK